MDESGPEGRPRPVPHAPLVPWRPPAATPESVLATFEARLDRFAPLTAAVVALTLWFYVVQLLFYWPPAWLLEGFSPGGGLLAAVLGEQLGWLTPETAQRGEWFRLVTATLLHHSLFHVVGNVVVTWSVGRLVENLLGRWAFVTIWVGAGAFGNALTLLAPEGWSIGASGAACGLLAASCVAGWRAKDRWPHELRDSMTVDLSASIVLVVVFSFAPGLNWMAHLGGLVAGAALGALWPVTLTDAEDGRTAPARIAVGAVMAMSWLLPVGLVGQRLPTVGQSLPMAELRLVLLEAEAGAGPALDARIEALGARVPHGPHWLSAKAEIYAMAEDWARAGENYMALEAQYPISARREGSIDNQIAWSELLTAPDDPQRVAAALRRATRAQAEHPRKLDIRNTYAWALVLGGRSADGLAEIRAILSIREAEDAPFVWFRRLGDPEWQPDLGADVFIEVVALVRLGRLREARARFDTMAPRYPEGTLIREAAEELDEAEAAERNDTRGQAPGAAPGAEGQ